MVFFEPSTFDFSAVAEKILPYLGVGFLGAILREIVVKYLNRGKDNSQNNKTDAEAVAIINKEFLAAVERLQAANNLNVELQRVSAAKDAEHLTEKAGLQKEIETMQEATVLHLGRIAEMSILGRRETEAYRRLTEKLDLPYWEADKDGKTVFINECWLKMFRVTIDTQSNWIERVVQADRLQIIEEWKKRLIDQDSTGAIEFRVMGDEGEAIDVRSVYTILRDTKGEPLKIIGVTVKR